MPKVFVGLGSNQGNQIMSLQGAVKALAEDPKIEIMKVSSVYKTEPVGYEDQPWFYNAVVEMETSYEPEELLDTLLQIEQILGRVRTIRWGPRTVDLDLLLYGDQVIETYRLSVPHPRMLERDFVLVPLAEIAPDLLISGVKITQILDKQKNNKKVICTSNKL